MNKSKCTLIALLIVEVLVVLAMGASLLGGCGTQTLAFRVTDTNSLSEQERAQCIPLFLPRTVLEFRCTGVVETTEPSRLWRMASDAPQKAGFGVNAVREQAVLLGITLNEDPNTRIKYSVRDPVLTTRGERDTDELFLIRIKCGPFQKAEFCSQFSADGVAGSVSSAVEDKTFEFATKTVETGAAIAGKVVGLRTLAGVRSVAEPGKPAPNLLEAVATRIKDVRTERESLISGAAFNVPADEKTLVRLLDELTKLEAGLVAYFTGVRTEESFPVTSTIRPAASTDSLFELFRLDEDLGFEANPDTDQVRLGILPERLYRKEAKRESNGSAGRRAGAAYVANLALSPRVAETNTLKQIPPSQGTEHGLPYRIPVRVFAEVRMEPSNKGQATGHGTKSLIKTEILLGQWGRVVYLPPGVGFSGSAFKPVYYTETGALKELTMTGMPLSADSLGSLDKATGSIADALKAQAEKEKGREDELNQLTREGDILEQKVRIQDLQERLPPSGTP